MDARGWDERYAGSELVWSAGPNQFVAAEVATLRPGRALDVAAGEGRNAIWLAQQGWSVTAVDFSPVGIDKGRRIAEHHGVDVEWVVADVVDYRPPERYDLVLIVYLHLESAAASEVYETACGALAPGGTLLVVGHHVDNIEHGYGGPQDATVLHDHQAIGRFVGRLDGIEVERAVRVTRDVETDDGPRTALDSLVRVRAANLGS